MGDYSIFERVIWTNPDVCSRCFARIKRDNKRYPGVLAGVAGHDHVVPDQRAPERATYPPRTICDDCGSVAGRGATTTMPTAWYRDRADALATRIAERGHDIDPDALEYAITKLFSYPELQGHEKAVLEAAVRIAVDHA